MVLQMNQRKPSFGIFSLCSYVIFKFDLFADIEPRDFSADLSFKLKYKFIKSKQVCCGPFYLCVY